MYRCVVGRYQAFQKLKEWIQTDCVLLICVYGSRHFIFVLCYENFFYLILCIKDKVLVSFFVLYIVQQFIVQ